MKSNPRYFVLLLLLVVALALLGCTKQETTTPSPTPTPSPLPPPKATHGCHNNAGVCELIVDDIKKHQNDQGHTCADFDEGTAIPYSLSGDTTGGKFKAIRVLKKNDTDPNFDLKLEACNDAPKKPFKNHPPTGKMKDYDTGPKNPLQSSGSLLNKHYRLLVPDEKTGKAYDPHIVIDQ